jgi:hypothetical protein
MAGGIGRRVVVHEKQSAFISHVLALPNGTVRRQGSYDWPNVHMCRSRSYNVSTGVDKRKVGQNREFRGSGRCCRWNYG